MFHFLFSSNSNLDEQTTLRDVGFTTSTFPEKVLNGKNDIPYILPNKRVVYRGPVLCPIEYENLSVAILARDSTPFVPAREYVVTFDFYNYFPFINELMSSTMIALNNNINTIPSRKNYFVIEGIPFSADGSEIPEIVNTCAKRIPSRFFSVETIKLADRNYIGAIKDGQTCSLNEWTPTRFAEIWKVIEKRMLDM